jgi:hypothetical protein
MSTADEFWQYAEEAMLRASRSTVEKERLALMDLARTWTQAALHSDTKLPGTGTPAR